MVTLLSMAGTLKSAVVTVNAFNPGAPSAPLVPSAPVGPGIFTDCGVEQHGVHGVVEGIISFSYRRAGRLLITVNA